MISTATAVLVMLFFLHGALASFIVGLEFWFKKDHTIKFFGMALIFSGLAFATWGLLAANRLRNLRVMASFAAVFLIVSLFCFLLAGIQHLQEPTSYTTALIVGAIGAIGLFVLRTFVYPAHLAITERGFIIFDLRTAVKAAYIFAISICILPATNAVAGKFKKTFMNPIIKGCFTTLAIGGIILVTTADTGLILLTGMAMTIAFLLLWVPLFFSNKKVMDKIT